MFLDAWQAWLTGGMLIAMVVVLAIGRFGPDLVMMGVLLVLLLAGVLEPEQAVSGFANPALVTVAMLYVVAAAMKETGAMNLVASKLIGRPKNVLEAQVRLSLPVAGLSAFVNNTPIVAMFLPALSGVARRGGFPVSKLFMPLSFASILGGVCTLIGTSTNVVVADLLRRENAAGNPVTEGAGLNMFTLALVGLPIAVLGLAYILVFSRWLLPDRTKDDGAEAADGYYVAMRVPEGSPIAGKSVEQAGLRHLPGLFLSRVDRRGDSIVVGPSFRLEENDTLLFVGRLDSVVDLQQLRGLSPVEHEDKAPEEDPSYRPNLRLIEAVVSTGSAFVGRTVRQAGIRTRYGAAVVAVRRQGQQIQGKLGDVLLRAGDTLLLEAPRGSGARFSSSPDFYLATERLDPAALRHDRAWIAMAVIAGLVAAISFGWLSPMVGAMAAAGAMIALRCCTGPQARSAVDFQVLIVIGAAFGIGSALQTTGLAGSIAHELIDWLRPLGPWALLAAVYLLTTAFTMTMTNNAAAVLMFPIALSIAGEADLNVLPFAVAICIAASCEFSTPIGYQTNLMVMGPGGYRWLDYTRFGGPLPLLAAAVCILLAPLVYGGF